MCSHKYIVHDSSRAVKTFLRSLMNYSGTFGIIFWNFLFNSLKNGFFCFSSEVIFLLVVELRPFCYNSISRHLDVLLSGSE